MGQQMEGVNFGSKQQLSNDSRPFYDLKTDMDLRNPCPHQNPCGFGVVNEKPVRYLGCRSFPTCHLKANSVRKAMIRRVDPSRSARTLFIFSIKLY